MSFATDIYAVMTGDSSLNSTINGGINYENLPDNFDLSKKWILYFFRISSQVNCLSTKNAYKLYALDVLLIEQNTEDLLSLTDYVINYLNGTEEGGIIDITFLNDAHSFDQEKNIYMNQLSFEVAYK